jgi:putative hydrolase
MRAMIFSDYHTHTVFSHGTGTCEQNVLAAIERGLSRVTISEHGPAHIFYGVRGERLRTLRREVDSLACRYANDIEVLFGLECNLTDYGECDAPEDASAICDVLLLAYHKGVRHKSPFMRRLSAEAFKLSKNDPVETANALLEAAEKHRITAFSHPGLYVKSDIATLAKGAAELSVLLEINSARVTMSAEELKQAEALGANFLIGSDAHKPKNVGNFTLGLNAAREAGVIDSVLNYVPDMPELIILPGDETVANVETGF